MIFGVWVLNAFSAVWSVVGVVTGGFPLWTSLIAIAYSVIVTTLCTSALIGLPDAPQGSHDHVGRLIGIWSAVEGVAIFVAINVLRNVGLQDYVVPAVALIVGLHFFPLARGIPRDTYYGTGAALIIVSVVAMFLPTPFRAPSAAFGTAVILWVSSVIMTFGPHDAERSEVR